MDEDTRHLELLSTFHYVLAGLAALFGCFPIIHLVIGILALSGKLEGNHGEGMPVFFGILFVGMASVMILMLWLLAISLFIAAGRLKKHIGYTYCFVVAAISCAFFPFGTVLGVLTIIVLLRPSVKTMFGVPTPGTASS